MKIRRHILKVKSGFYYYTLVFVGAASLLLLTRCQNKVSEEERIKLQNDSIARAKAIHDSIAKADSTEKALKEKQVLDSIARADSIAKAKKPAQNPYKPPKPMTKYGVPISKPIAEYGVPPVDN